MLCHVALVSCVRQKIGTYVVNAFLTPELFAASLFLKGIKSPFTYDIIWYYMLSSISSLMSQVLTTVTGETLHYFESLLLIHLHISISRKRSPVSHWYTYHLGFHVISYSQVYIYIYITPEGKLLLYWYRCSLILWSSGHEVGREEW